ncbi:unnamed protein product [Durusdinium trenchii]|uniref:Uncharacterized protein n=1 Tax=Durusdinium trenchii TaxID=1381693 RepID=A0ABP0QPX3_9DINO
MSRPAACKRFLAPAAALLVYVFSLSCDVYDVPMVKFQMVKCMGRKVLANRCRLGRKAAGCPIPMNEKLYTDVLDLAGVFDRNERFGEFADDLLPSVPHPVDDIVAVVKRHAEKLFPGCTLSLAGSCDRQVHNKYFSDIDIQVHNLTLGAPSEGEFHDFCSLLEHDTDVRKVKFEKGCKAIRLEVWGIPVDVAFTEQFDKDLAMHGPAQTSRLKELYEEYPGAVKAARVAKWIFQDLRGMDVEYIVNDIARDSSKLWENRKRDSHGCLLFRGVVIELAQFPGVSHYSSLRELEKKARTARGRETLLDLEWSLKRSQVLAKVLLQELHCTGVRSKQAEDLQTLCQNVSMIEYECLTRERNQTSANKLALRVEKEMSISQEGVDLGFSVKLESDNAKGKATGVIQPRKQRKKRQGERDSHTAWSNTWEGKLILIFDDMLFCVENSNEIKQAKPLERKFIQAWCTGVDAFLEMATKKQKHERWKSRTMPEGMHQVAARMKALGIASCDMMYSLVEASDWPAAWKAPLLAFLWFWRSKASS